MSSRLGRNFSQRALWKMPLISLEPKPRGWLREAPHPDAPRATDRVLEGISQELVRLRWYLATSATRAVNLEPSGR